MGFGVFAWLFMAPNVIQPLVMGNQARIHPVLILVSFLLLGAFLGPAGLLLAVPAVILVISILDQTVLDGSLREQQKEEGDGSGGWLRRLASCLASRLASRLGRGSG